MSERKGDDAVRVPIEIKTEDLSELQQLIQQLTEAEEAARTARASGAALPSKGAAGPQTFGGQAKRTGREGAAGEGPVEYLAVKKVCRQHHKHSEIDLEDRLCRERMNFQRYKIKLKVYKKNKWSRQLA